MDLMSLKWTFKIVKMIFSLHVLPPLKKKNNSGSKDGSQPYARHCNRRICILSFTTSGLKLSSHQGHGGWSQELNPGSLALELEFLIVESSHSGFLIPHSHQSLVGSSRVRLFATPWTAARQAPLSVGLFRQENRSGLPCSSPRALPTQGCVSCISCIGRQILYH